MRNGVRLCHKIASSAALSSLVLTGCANQQKFQIGPSKGEVVGVAVGAAAAIAVGTIVIVEVHKSHHTLKGCVTSTPDGLQLLNEGNRRIYALTGVTTNVKAGDIIRVHGSKMKHGKDVAGDQDFAVEKVVRDYGACMAPIAPQHAAGY